MPEGNFGSVPGKQNKVKEFIGRNKFLTGLICVAVVLSIIMILVNTLPYNKKLPASAEADNTKGIDISQSTTVDVLPQIQRSEDTKQEGSSDNKQARNPFTGPVTLKGTIIGDNGNNQALIEAGGISYVVKVNEKVGDVWTVKKIDRKQVVLASDTKELTLVLAEVLVPANNNQSNPDSSSKTNSNQNSK